MRIVCLVKKWTNCHKKLPKSKECYPKEFYFLTLVFWIPLSNWRSLRITVKRNAPCRCLGWHVKKHYKMSMAWEPDLSPTSSSVCLHFYVPSHIMTCMAEISSTVKSSNSYNITSSHFLKPSFYAPGSNDRGHIVFVLSVCLSVCLFVCLLSTLTFAITFEPLEAETSYLACILH